MKKHDFYQFSFNDHPKIMIFNDRQRKCLRTSHVNRFMIVYQIYIHIQNNLPYYDHYIYIWQQLIFPAIHVKIRHIWVIMVKTQFLTMRHMGHHTPEKLTIRDI